MKPLVVCAVVFTGLLAGCSARDPETTAPESHPSLVEGFYGADAPETKSIPLVAIRVDGGKTFAYSYLAYACAGHLTATFDLSGLAFSEQVPSLSPSEIREGNLPCVVGLAMRALSDRRIEVTLTLDGVKQPPYILTQMERATFVAEVKSLARRAERFYIPQDLCFLYFEELCSPRQVRNQRQNPISHRP